MGAWITLHSNPVIQIENDTIEDQGDDAMRIKSCQRI